MNAITKEAYELLHKGTLALANAEQAGMRIDLEYCERMKHRLSKKISMLEKEFKATKFYKHWAHVAKNPNIDSNFQLAHFLYNVKKLKPVRLTASGKGAVDEESLAQLNIPEVGLIVQMRKLRKIRDTYLDAFVREQVNGVIHPFYNLHTVRTFRSSSDRPNFQNIPKRDKEAMALCRKAIYPRPGHQLLEIDYAGIEVRISQCYHKDPTMQKYIEDPHSDMHLDMAGQIFLLPDIDKSIPEHKVLRNAAKNGFVFPQFYGDYYANCAENMACRWGGLPKGRWKHGQGITMPSGTLSDHLLANGISSYEAFENHIKEVEKDFWGRRFMVYQQWKEKWWRRYQKRGYIDTLSGFRCVEPMRKNECINTPIQGAAFHCLLWTFIEIDRIAREENWDSRPVGQIHDAIVLDVAPTELDYVFETVRRVACEDIRKAWPWIIVPLDVEADICPVDGPWSEKETYQRKEEDGLEGEFDGEGTDDIEG